MKIFKNSYITLILISVLFYNFSFSKESYLIKKTTKDSIPLEDQSDQNNLPPEVNKNKSNKKEENNIKNQNLTIKEKQDTVNKNGKYSLKVNDNKFRIIYKPNQINLGQEDIIKVIEISRDLNRENILTIKSYASKKKNQGSSEARRVSLSRALEIRSLFIENEFPATNILIRALGTEKNNEGFTDVVIVEVN